MNFTSVKLSNNALNFLLAQYRAIFKRAYVKGLAAAVMLTAGLAAGQAQAAQGVLYDPNLLPDSGETFTFDGVGSTADDKYTHLQIQSGSGSWHGEVIITSGDATFGSAPNYITGNNPTSISGTGTLTIDIANDANYATEGLVIAGNSTTAGSGTVSIDIGTIAVNNGTLNIEDEGAAGQSGSVTVAANTITVGSEGAGNEATAYLTLVSTQNQGVTLGRAADTTTDTVGSQISVLGGGVLTLQGTSTTSGTQILGELLDIGTGGTLITNSGSNNFVKTSDFNVNDGAFHVISGSSVSETFQGETAQIAGNFLIGAGAGWVVEETANKNAQNKDFVPSATFESGANVQLGGSLTLSGGTLTVASGAGLYATQASDGTSTSGTIVVTNSGDAAGTLKIGSSDLKQFLTAKDGSGSDVKFYTIKDNSGKYELSKTEDGTAAQGSVFLSKGVLELSDQNQVDLATSFAFSGGTSNGKSGTIVVDSTNGGTVKGHDLKLSKGLSGGITSANKLVVEADALTLGIGSGAATENKLSAFNISGAVVHDSLTLEANDGQGTFTVDSDLTFKGDYYAKDDNGDYITSSPNPVGPIKGDNIVLSGTSALAPMKITGGAWENEGQALTIQSGSLAISAVAGSQADESGSDTNGQWDYYKNGNPASLTWHGDFVISGATAATDAAVTVSGASGADATLDLRDADITWGSGSITLSGAIAAGEDDPVQVSPDDYFARAGQGILRLDGDQVARYLDIINTGNDATDTKTTMTIQSGGLLLVDGSINGDVNVERFENKAQASATAGNINISGGHMFVTGSLSLVDGVDADGKADATVDGLTFGGVLGADSITLTNKSTAITEAMKGTDQDVATVSGGTLAVASTFRANNHAVKFVSGAGLLLDSNGFLSDYAPDTVGEGGSVRVDHLIFSGVESSVQSKLDVQTGAWTIGTADDLGDVDLLSGAALRVGPEEAEYIRTGVGASLTADNLGVTNGTAVSGSVTLDVSSAVTVNTLQMDSGATLTVGDDATFTVTGNIGADTFGEDGKVNPNAPATLVAIGNADKIKAQAGINLSGAEITLNSGKFVLGDTAARALVAFDTTADEGKQVTINAGLSGADFKLTGTSELRLDFTKGENENTLSGVNGGLALTAQQAKELKEKLIGTTKIGTTDFSVGSYINVGDLALGMDYDPDTMTAQWSEIEDFVQIESDVTNDDLMQLLIKNADQGKYDLSGQFGAVETSEGTSTANVAGALGLHKAYSADGTGEKFFASTVNSNGVRTAVGLTLDTDSSVAFYGEGTVGTLRGQGVGSDTTVYFNEGDFQTGTTVVKPINANDTAIEDIGHMVVANNVIVEGNAEVGSMTVTRSFTAQNLTLGNQGHDGSTVFGTVEISDTLTVLNGTTLQIADGAVTTNTLALNGSTLRVGWDAQGVDNPNTDIKENQSYSGRVYASVVDLSNGGGIVVDPALTDSTAIVGFKQFKGGNRTETSFDLGETGGNLFVGQNSAIGAGFASMEDLVEFIKPQQVGDSLSGHYKALAAVDGLMTISTGTGLTMTAQSFDDFIDYIKEGSGSHWSTALNTTHGTIANTAYFGADSALKLSSDAVKAAKVEGTDSPAVITFESNGGQLIAQGGEIVISGDLRANSNTQYKLFADAGTGDANGTKVSVVDINGTAISGTGDNKGILVTTENGFLYGYVNDTNGGTISLAVDKANAASIMNGASDPVVQTLIAYAQGYNSEYEDESGTTQYDDLYYGYYDTGVRDPESGDPILAKDTEAYYNYFLAASIEQGNGSAAETAARFGVYGGAPQAAIQAGKSSTDAIAQRFGIGSAVSNLTLAGNTQGAALWLAPVYKSSDSDGFEAQGVDYGVNVDLYGVALGADYTLANGITFGAMFNVGSGEVDGEGAASSTSNDFDYYGFGLYAGYTMGQFSVVGDVSYTSVDNDLEGNTSVDRIGASMDSTNLSIGVTGKYELSFNGVDITPHAGLRFSNIDLDDYTIDGRDTVAAADSDDMAIFSIPVGVTVAKEFKGETWTVAPSFDLTLTGQFGDDELDGEVSWAGVSNLSTHTTTEVFDNFTYGATLGVEAQSVSGVALGISVGYTGSSNTDELGVNANARFVF